MTLPPPLPPFSSGWTGPRNAKIVLVGEAWGENEAHYRRPLVGESGKEAFRMLGEAWPEVEGTEELRSQIDNHSLGDAWIRGQKPWLEAAGAAITNVFNFRPPSNKLEHLCLPRKELPKDYPELPALIRGGYLRPEFFQELDRLYTELHSCRPNLILALGNTACWALLHTVAISSIRGTTTQTSQAVPIEPWLKVLPTYHPAGVLYNWSWRTIVLTDLMKGRREGEFPEIRRPERKILVNPSLSEVESWIESTLHWPPPLLACDTETSMGIIDTIGFAKSRDDILVIPLGPHRQTSGQNYTTIWPRRNEERTSSYWTREEEIEVWGLIQRLLESQIPKVFQNGLYDLQYILRMGIRPKALEHDTMLLSHSLFPEMPKGLGFLGSIYTDEASWKLMRKRKGDSEKRDE